MEIDVAISVAHLKQEEMKKKCVIVIDSLRATSTILIALKQGCRKVIPVETVGQALKYKGKDNVILIGERYSKKVAGFDYGNSPIEINEVNLHNKTVVITSTNGTKALQKVKRAAQIFVGCFLNAQHCVEQAMRQKRDITFVCAGRRGDFAIEDGLTAGLMIHYMREMKPDICCSDMALMLESNYVHQAEHLQSIISQGATGRRLQHIGLKDDIPFCLQINLLQHTGLFLDGGIIAVK